MIPAIFFRPAEAPPGAVFRRGRPPLPPRPTRPDIPPGPANRTRRAIARDRKAASVASPYCTAAAVAGFSTHRLGDFSCERQNNVVAALARSPAGWCGCRKATTTTERPPRGARISPPHAQPAGDRPAAAHANRHRRRERPSARLLRLKTRDAPGSSLNPTRICGSTLSGISSALCSSAPLFRLRPPWATSGPCRTARSRMPPGPSPDRSRADWPARAWRRPRVSSA